MDHNCIAYPQATWTSFDRYDRYAEIARVLRSALGPGAHRVLDVGDTAGYLQYFEHELWVAGIDLHLEDARLEGSRPLIGDGARLPFPDGSFDAVVSSDVLEHVPPDHRPAFLAELRRVSRDLVIVAAPFDTAGVAGVEEFVRRYAMLVLGAKQPQLEEHRENGLPNLEETLAALLAAGGEGALVGNGNLWEWMVSMLLRFQLEARPALQPLSEGFDLFQNGTPEGGAQSAPFYRHLVVCWLNRAPGLVAADESSTVLDLASLAAVLVAANSAEIVRQDVNEMLTRLVVPPVAVSNAGIVALHERLDPLSDIGFSMPGQFDRLQLRFDRLDEVLHQHFVDVHKRFDALDHVVGSIGGWDHAAAEEVARLHDEIEHLHGRAADTRARLEELFESQMAINLPLLRAKSKVLRLSKFFRSRLPR